MGKRMRTATRAVRTLHQEGDGLLAEIIRLSAVAQRIHMPVTAAVLRQVSETGVAELRAAETALQEELVAHGRLIEA
jgi:ribosomal protein L28